MTSSSGSSQLLQKNRKLDSWSTKCAFKLWKSSFSPTVYFQNIVLRSLIAGKVYRNIFRQPVKYIWWKKQTIFRYMQLEAHSITCSGDHREIKSIRLLLLLGSRNPFLPYCCIAHPVLPVTKQTPQSLSLSLQLGLVCLSSIALGRERKKN